MEKNEKIKEYGYIQFPLCLLMTTYNDIKHGLGMIIDYGIVNYAMKLSYSLQDVAKQTAYDYYRKKDVLQRSLVETLDEEENEGGFTFDEDYNGFSGSTFNPEENISEILKIFERDEKFKKDAILNYQIHLATSADHLNITVYSNDKTTQGYRYALNIKNEFEKQFGPDAMPFCKKHILFEFKDGQQKDIDVFRAFIGIKSMLGHRNFISSNKPAILSRMLGCKSKSAFEYYTTNRYNKNKNLLPTIEKYSKRYHMDKLLLTLAERKFIMHLSKEKVSVIYLSKYMEPEDLGKLVKETRARQNIKKRIKDVTASL